MNEEIKNLINPILLEAIIELSKQDLVIENCLKKTDTSSDFINSLISAIVCISDRELTNIEKLESILKANPKIKEMLEGINDPAMLCESNS